MQHIRIRVIKRVDPVDATKDGVGENLVVCKLLSASPSSMLGRAICLGFLCLVVAGGSIGASGNQGLRQVAVGADYAPYPASVWPDYFLEISIFGGSYAGIEEISWQAAILSETEISGPTPSLQAAFVCGATIVDETWVLTAWHCVKDFSAKELVIAYALADLRELDQKGLLSQVEKIHMAPDGADLAMLQVDKLVLDRVTASAIALNENGFIPAVDSSLNASGWGLAGFFAPLPEEWKLRSAHLSVVESLRCNYRSPESAQKRLLCVWANDAGTCPLDSGGPLTVHNGSQLLVGIITKGKCNRSIHGRHARVSYSIDWIKGLMQPRL